MTVQFPERIEIPSGDSPPTPSPFPEPVAEQYAIIGEDARQIPMQGFRTVKQTSLFLPMASGLTASAFGTAYASLAASEAMVIDRAKQATFRVAYTPGAADNRILLYPQVSQGENPTAWTFVEAEADVLVQVVGPTDPPTFAVSSLGYYAKDPFANLGAMPAAGAEYTATFVLHPKDRFPACRMIRWVIRDTSLTTPGTVIILGTQE